MDPGQKPAGVTGLGGFLDTLLEWVERVLSAPKKLETDPSDPALNHALGAIPEYGGRVLRVVYNKDTKPWKVITAFFDRAERGKL
jgi:hypothetical protein